MEQFPLQRMGDLIVGLSSPIRRKAIIPEKILFLPSKMASLSRKSRLIIETIFRGEENGLLMAPFGPKSEAKGME
jgi:hypothetical protein